MRHLRMVAVVVFFLLILAGIGGYFVWQRLNPTWNWQTYKSVKYGYLVRFPKDWQMDDTRKSEAADIISDPSGKALIVIQFYSDRRLLDKDGERKVLSDIKKLYANNRSLSISSFESRFEEGGSTPATVSGYMVKGAEGYKGDVYSFLEYGVPLGDEFLAMQRILIRENSSKELGETAKKVATTFDPLAARVAARDLVRKEKEVKEYEEMLAKGGKKATASVSDDGESWLVQVYEIVVEGGGTHTATFNWYRVDKKTLEVTKEFQANE